MLKCIIYDFDGVIIDSLAVQRYAYYESCREVLGKNIKVPSFEEYMKYTGDSLYNIFKKLSLPETLVQPYRIISQKSVDKIVVNNEIVDYIRKIKAMNIKMALCTGKDRVRTIEILKFYNIDDLFDNIVCSDDISNPKPHRESLDKIMEEMQLDVSECIMVGDGTNDILCAENANMNSILTKWCDGRATDCYPTYIANTVSEFISIIDNIIEIEEEN